MSMFGFPSGPMSVGTGQGWLADENTKNQLLAALYGAQGQLGSGILQHLATLVADPTAGAMGLLPFAKYGSGAQNIAAGTHGAGIASPYAGLMDRLLQGLSQSVMNPGSPFNPDNNGQYNTDAAKIDPNKAPMMTPESAAKAPNDTEKMFQQWASYSDADKNTLKNIAGVPNPPPEVPRVQPPGYETGGAADTGGMTIGGQPHFIVDSLGKKVAALTEDGKPEHVGGIGGVEVTPLDPQRHAAYEQSKQRDKHSMDWANLLAGIEHGFRNPSAPTDGAGTIPQMLPGAAGGATFGFPDPSQATAVDPNAGNMQRVKDAYARDPQGANTFFSQKPEDLARMFPAQGVSGADSGGMLKGNGAPTGPVTWNNPAGSVPEIPGNMVGPNMIPTLGGPNETREDQTGNPQFTGYDESQMGTQAGRIGQYDRALGADFAKSYTGIPGDIIREMSQGLAPSRLLNAQQMGMLLPSERSRYLALLQNMGLGNPEDIKAQIAAGRPEAMTGPGGFSSASFM